MLLITTQGKIPCWNIAEWDLNQEKLVAITMDSGANVKMACGLLRR